MAASGLPQIARIQSLGRIAVGITGNSAVCDIENGASNTNKSASLRFEVIDSEELAKRWSVPESWVRDQVRSRAQDPIPHVRLGKYIRFEWGSPELDAWWARRRTPTKQSRNRDGYKGGIN
jgi:hypothetical protein